MLTDICTFTPYKLIPDFLDYYYDLLTYIQNRKQRLSEFKSQVQTNNVNGNDLKREWKYYCGKERAYLRKRRTRLRFSSFNIVTQIGQGGYGKVFQLI